MISSYSHLNKPQDKNCLVFIDDLDLKLSLGLNLISQKLNKIC
jgi:hypothetical protein